MNAVPASLNAVRSAYPGIDGLVRAADAVEAMMSSEGWQVLCGLIDSDMAAVEALLDHTTSIPTRSEYAAAHGRRRGLRTFQQHAQALIERRDRVLAEQRAKHEQGAIA